MQPERKRKNYQPFPGFCDLRLFDLNSKQFEAAWRVQEYLYRASKCREYYRQLDGASGAGCPAANAPPASKKASMKTKTKG